MMEKTASHKQTGDQNKGSHDLLQRKCACGQHNTIGGVCAECRKKRHRLQRRAVNESGPATAPPIVHEVLRSPGQPLAPATRAFMEPRFGHDFSQVRVHTDTRAAESARAVNALAYTVGRDVVFEAGQYAPGSRGGMGLLAHELAHVVQQVSNSATPSVPLGIGAENSAEERQAERLVTATTRGQTVLPQRSVTPQLMRATRTFALTFDDGPHTAALGKGKNRTEKVLDTLKAKGIKVGFFIQTGVSYRGASRVGRSLVKRMHKEGHKVGIHTGGPKDHELHTKAQKAGRLETELESAKEYIKEQTGETPTLVRPPTGKSSKEVLKIYEKLDLTNLLWDIDGDQGKNFGLGELKARIESGIKKVHDGGWKGTTPSAPRIVVLYHDIQKGTAENLDAVIEHIKKVTRDVSDAKDTADFGPP